MRTNSQKLLKWLSLIFMLVFIMGQILGILAIRHYFIVSKIEELTPELEFIAKQVIEGETFHRNKSEFIIKAYDLQGEALELMDEEVVQKMPFKPRDEALVSLMPEVMKIGRIALLENVPGLPSKSIIIGQKLLNEGEVLGVIFLLKPASDYRAALNGFSSVFWFTSLIGAIAILFFIAMYLKKIRALEQMRKNYIANISHELRTPIASIKALMEPLCDELIIEENTKMRYYHIIYSEAGRLEHLISDMLELSKLQNGKMVLEKMEFDLNGVIGKLEDQFSILAEDIGVNFVVTAKHLPKVYSNENRVLQVLNILIDNAMKFAPEESQIILGAKVSEKQVELYVKDEGEGIPKEELEFVFERFYKGKFTKSGSGLGLSIAKEIMKALGETVRVESQVGKGTCFYITIKRS